MSSTMIPDPSETAVHLKAKTCLVGEPAVGKTSLIRRFVRGQFGDAYVTTLGVQVSTKRVVSPAPERVEAELMIWDIMGSRGFRDLLQHAYFNGAHGVLAVFDVTRPETLRELDAWIASVYRVAGPLPVRILGNKADLRDHRAVSEEDLRPLLEKYHAPYLLTSAKTGENVEAAFDSLVAAILEAGREKLRR